MNEDAIKDAYDLFVNTGYNKSYDNFKKLIQSNPSARKDAYDLFVGTGYNKTQKDFDELMGIGAPVPVKKKEQVSPSQQKAQPTSSATGAMVPGGAPVPSAKKGPSLQEQLQSGINLAASAAVASSKPGFTPVPKEQADKALYGKAKVQTGTLRGVPGERASTVKNLNDKYKDLGVQFNEAPSKIQKAVGLGDIVVTADDGSTHIVQSTGSDEKLREEEAKLQSFLMGKSAGVEKKPITPMEFLMMSRDGISPQEEGKFKRVYSQEMVDNSIKFANDELNNTKKAVDDINKEVAQLNEEAKKISEIVAVSGVTPDIEETYNSITQRYQDLQARADERVKYAKSIGALADEGVKKAVGENTRLLSYNGNIPSALYNSLLKGAKDLVGGAMAALPEVADIATLGASESFYGDKAKAKEDSKKFLDEIYDNLKAEGVSKEYTTEGNMAWKSLFAVPEFIPSLLVPGGAAARVTAMTTQGIGRRFEEMNSNPETKNLPEEEKFFMAAGPALVEAKLENFGLTQWLGANKGLASSIFINALSKVAPKAGVQGLNKIINAEISNLALRGAANTAGAMISEFETGALQNISETAFRDAYEIAKGKNLFKQPGFGEDGFKKALLEDAMLEGLGGMWMAGAVNIAQQTSNYITGKSNTNETFRLVKQILADETTSKSLVATLKSQIMDGKLSKEQAVNTINNFNEARAIAMELPQDLSEDNQRKAFDLIAEKRKLTKQIEGKDPSLVDKQKTRITAIDQELKNISNAVQEQATSEVPVQPGAAVSGEVAQGEPQAEPEVVTEEIIPQEEIATRQAEAESKIKGKDLFSDGGTFSNVLGGSGVDSVPTAHSETNGIEFVQFSNPTTGQVDVIMTGTSDSDFVGFYRIYENGKPTNKWSSKFENQSRNKENFKTMISGVQSMLPNDHEYTEKTSISTDGLRVWNQQLDRGYELQFDDNGNVVTNEVAINGDAIVNELGIDVLPGEFENISVTTNDQFNKVRKAILPYLKSFGLSESNIKWEDGTVKIDLPVLKKAGVAQAEPQVVTEEGQAQKEVIPAGKRLFNEPNPETVEISKAYKEKNGIVEGEGVKIEAVDVDNASKIADAFEALEDSPNDPEVQDAYNAMADETAKQHQDIVDAGYEVEIWDGEGEPYANAQEMIDDVKNNKHMYIFSTEQGFGDEPITDEQRNQNKLLQDSGLKDKNGKPLLYNDLFRFVHDFFGHTERGNGFGPVGEENAWDVHARMYSPKARRAMTTETRGQNSWVNFGPQMRNEDGSLKKKGDPGYLSPKDRAFAPQKMALMPEEFSQIREVVSEFDQAVNNSAQSLKMVAPDLKVIVAENTEDAQLQIAEALSAVAPSQAADVAEGFTTETRGQTVFVNGKPFAIVLDKSQADSKTVGHEAWELMLNDAFGDDQAKFKEFRDEIDRQLRLKGFGDIADALTKFSNQRGYEDVKYSEYMAELGGMLVADGFKQGSLDAKQKSLLQKIGDVINKFAQLFTGKKQFLDEATPDDILGFMITISNKVAKGEDVSQFFRQEPGTIIDQNDVVIDTRASKKQKFENNKYETKQPVYNPKGGLATVFTFIADRMGTGEWTGLNPESGIKVPLMGGIGYPMLKKLYKKAGWAVDGGSVMSSFLNKIVKSKTGIGVPVIMSEYSHVSNLTFAKIFEAEMDWMVKSGETTAKEQLDNINKYIADSLIAKKDLSPKLKKNEKTGLMEDKNANAPLRVFTTEKNGTYTPKTYKSMDEVYKELEATFGARALFMQNMIGIGVKNRYAKIEKYNLPDMIRVADETADSRLKGVPSGSAVSAIQFDKEKAKKFVADIGSNKDLKKYHSASAVGVDPHISYEYVVEGESLGWLPGVIDLAEAEGVDEDTKAWYEDQRAKYKEGKISEAQLRSNVTAKARASMPEVTIKTKSQKAVPAVVDEVLTDDGKGNYVFVHYSDERRDTIKPMSGSKKGFTSREEVAAISSVGGVAMYYTRQGQKEQGVGNVAHTVLVPKDKVYFYGTTERGKVSNDPENFEPEARRRFQEYKNRGNEGRPTEYAFDSNNAAAWVGKVAAENGYDMLVTNWGAPTSYRAQTVKELTPETDYVGFKEIPDPTYEVGDEVFLYGKYAILTDVKPDVLTYETENQYGGVDTGKFPLTVMTRDKIIMVQKAKPTVTTKSQKVVVNTIPGYERFLNQIEGMMDKGIKNGTSYNKITENVIEYIQRDSAVYERADDLQREQIIRDFLKIRGEKFKVAPSVGKILGQIKDVKKVTVNEKTALKEQIKLEAKAAKDAVAFVKQLRMQISGRLKMMAGRGVISAKQASAILARYDRMNILNPDMRDRFVDYMANVFESAEYADKVKEANKLRKTIRKAAKSPDNQAENSKMAKSFAEIDPSRVENIDDYINNAEQMLKAVSRKTGDVKMRSLINMTDMVSYIDGEIQAQREQVKNEILSKYQDLVYAGVLDSKMTINEIKKVVAAIEENEDESAAKAKEAKEAVKQMMEEVSPILLQIARTGEDPFTGDPIDLTQDEKASIVKLAKMDLDNLPLSEAVKALEYANNFVANGVTSGIVGMVDLYEGSLNTEKLVKKGFKSIPIKKYFSPGAGRIWMEQIASLPMVNKLMWGSTSRALEVSEASGVTGVSNGKAKAIKIVEKAVKEYVATFSKVKDFLSSENVIERGMLAFVSRTVIGDEFQAQDEFNRRKSLIEETIQALKDPENSTDAEIKKGEVVEKVYNKILKDAKNAKEVRANVSEINKKAVDWWVNEWSKHYDRMDEVSRNVYNTLLSRDANFTPDRFQLKEVSPAAEEDFDSGFFGNFENVSTEKSGSLKENKRIKNLPQNKNGVKTRIVNLDFDVNNVNALTNAMVDVETAGSVMQMKGFVTSKDFAKLFSSKEDKNVYKKRLVSYVNRAKGQGYVDQSELKTLNRLVNTVASFGTAKALFSLSQPFKQSIPPLFNTLVQTGRLDLGTLMAGGFSFIDRTGYPIANRGISSQGELKSINRQLVEAEKNLLLRGVDGVAAYSNLMLELTLKYPDIMTARSSWLSFYKKGLKKEGIKTSGINWNTHEVNKKAADYAQMMVDSQQNISDSDMQGEFMASKDPAKAFLRRAIFPLMTFVLNQKTRIWADIRTLSNKAVTTAEDRQEAALSLAGALVELGAFSAISYAANSMLWEVAMNVLAAVSGEDDDDDREEEKKKMILRRSAYTAQNFMKDFFVPPIPGADLLASKGINYILDETNLSSEIPADWFGIEDDRVKFRLYDKENQGYLDMLGTQGIALEKALELADYYDMAIDGTFKEESYGTKREKQILEGDADMARINAAIMTGYYGGLLPADVAYIVGQINKKIKKRAEVVEEED